MAETYTFRKRVLPGYHEYLASMSVSAFEDAIEIEFDDDFIIDQISVESINGWHVELKYPASGVTTPRIMNPSGNAVLNPYSSSRTGRMWYRIPAYTKMILTVDSTSPTSETLKLTVLGRG